MQRGTSAGRPGLQVGRGPRAPPFTPVLKPPWCGPQGPTLVLFAPPTREGRSFAPYVPGRPTARCVPPPTPACASFRAAAAGAPGGVPWPSKQASSSRCRGDPSLPFPEVPAPITTTTTLWLWALGKGWEHPARRWEAAFSGSGFWNGQAGVWRWLGRRASGLAGCSA